MKIQTRIMIGAALSLVVSLVVVFVVSSVLRNMGAEAQRARIFEEIERKTHALHLSLAGFSSHPEPSRTHQIGEIRRSLENLLAEMSSSTAREEFLVRQIRTNSHGLDYVLQKLISSTLAPSDALKAERCNVLISELWMKTQFISDDTDRLMEISRLRIDAAQQKAVALTLSLIVVLMLANALISFFTGKSIVRMQRGLHHALAESEEGDRMLSALMAYVPAGIAMADAKMNLTRISRYGQGLFGGPQEGERLQHVIARWNVFLADGKTPVADEDLPLVRAVLNGEIVKNIELVQVDENGELVPLLCTAGPMRDADGKVTGGIFVWRDIAERKRAEEALRQMNETLEQRVAERTQLAEIRARQLQSMAVELIEAEERERQRIADLLHEDLQQILASARFQLHALGHSLPGGLQLENVQQLLEDSIAISRRLAHRLSPPVLRQFGLVAALKWLVRQMSDQFGLHVELKTDAAGGCEIEALQVFLYRAVQELLLNVVKHAGVTSARVVFSRSEGTLMIKVSDHGKGFDPALLDLAAGDRGFGLLSLRERASYMGGNLIVSSRLGQGSSVTLGVPIMPAKNDALRRADTGGQPVVQATPSPPAGAEPTRVLFVDDHKVMRQGLIKMLSEQPDIQVVGEAANGREAVEQARLVQPHVIIMDIAMPEMDGIEATRRIKAELPNVRVVGLSMYEDEQLVRTMREAGAGVFVKKNASSAELLKAIYGWSYG